MARMLPPTINNDNPSGAERKLFEKIKRELSNEWTAVHSLGLTSHNRKSWAEIDFVLIGPTGVFCLEVKGGRVERRDGLWLFTDRYDRTSYKAEGPFDQVGSASSALYNYLKERLKYRFESVVGYGVCFPDIQFSVRGPDLESNTVYDARDGTQPFTQYVYRLADYWHASMKRRHGRTPQELTEFTRGAILESIRGDFHLRPSLASRVDEVNSGLIRLTEEQDRALSMFRDNPRTVIVGCAGSGKTLLAVTEAERLAAIRKRVLFCCYNKHLATFLQGVLTHDNIKIIHLHGYMADVIDRANLRNQLPAADEDDLYSVFMPMLCIEGMENLEEKAFYDALIVDEAQDLLQDTYIEVLRCLLKGGLEHGYWRIFLDPYQNLFDGLDQLYGVQLDGYSPAKVRLTRNCRNTAPIATATQILSQAFFDEIVEVEGPDVEEYWYCDIQDLRKKLSNCLSRLLSEGIRHDQIVLLSPKKLENSAVYSGMRGFEGKIRKLAPGKGAVAGTIGFSTISTFKGMEADIVLLIDIDTDVRHGFSELMYVGASRPRTLLGMFMHEGLMETYNERAREYGRHFGLKLSKSQTS